MHQALWITERVILFAARAIGAVAGTAAILCGLLFLFNASDGINPLGMIAAGLVLLGMGSGLVVFVCRPVKNARQVMAEEKQDLLAEAQYDVQAEVEVAVNHIQGDAGFEKDEARGAALLRAAAEKGHAEASLLLGTLHQTGHGVPQDDAEALKYYLVAAGAGDAQACRELYDIYEQGLGVEKNPEEALRWLRKSADAGDAEACAILGVKYSKEKSPGSIDKAIPYLEIASAQGDVEGTYYLASCWLTRTDGRHDWLKGMTLMRQAGEGGDIGARAVYTVYSMPRGKVVNLFGSAKKLHEVMMPLFEHGGTLFWLWCRFFADKRVARERKRQLKA